MDLFTYLMAKKGHNTHRDLFSYLLGKGTGGSGTYTTFSGTSLNISNTLQAKIKNIALEGNTSQDGTPTPDTPIPIKVVTGEQNIQITGKNLFDKDNANIINGYIQTGNTTLLSNGSTNKLIYISIKSSTTYTISKKVFSSSSRFGIATSIEEPATGISISNATQQNNNSYLTVTSGQNDKYLIVYPWTSNNTYTLEEALDTIQIEEGSTATTYEPYQSQTYPLSLGNIELARIGNYKDYIFKNVVGSPYYNADLELNEWYLHKENIIQNLWQMNWIYDSKYSTPVPRTVLHLEGMIPRGNYLSNCFLSSEMDNQQITNRLKTNSSKWFISLANSLTGIETTDSSGTKLNKIITYLQSVSANICYRLTTPTNTKITDTTLIQQLENINNNARSYKETTIIECASESTDNEVIGFSGDIKVTSVGLGNSLNTSLLSNNLQNEEPLSLDNTNEEEIEELIEKEVS